MLHRRAEHQDLRLQGTQFEDDWSLDGAAGTKRRAVRRALADWSSLRRLGAVLVALVMLASSVVLIHPAPADAADTATRWDSFSESSNCGDPFTRTPFVSKQGSLSDGEAILGPFGTYFGRSISEVRTQLVRWTVPGSGGRSVLVHRAMLPALQQVEANLAANAAAGLVYPITSVGGFNPRTVAGTYQMSRHAVGLALDINPAQNPQRADGRLITNMPAWFVDAWRSSGFCWGGDWVGAKDPMHFSWMGPGAAGSPPTVLTPSSPLTGMIQFGGPAASHPTPFAPVMGRYAFSVHDGTGNGAPDVVGLRSHQGGSVIDIASSTAGYGECSIVRWFVPNSEVVNAQHMVFGDLDGDSGQDLVALSPSGETLTAIIATRRQNFEDLQVMATGLGADAVAVNAADFDGDGIVDLWEATPDGRIRIWGGPSFTNTVQEGSLDAGTPMKIAAGDRHGGDTPELYALYSAGEGARIDVLSFSDSWSQIDSVTVASAAGSIAVIGAGDYDGDGRSDAQVLDFSGTMTVHLGNTPTGILASRWFVNPLSECDDTDVRMVFNGTFYDDDTSQFEANIEAIAAAGITLGCNPPFVDRFCPDRVVTRGQMAAFLVRGLGLETNSSPGFGDVPPSHVFFEEIGRLATAGITRGCNLTGDLFCPESAVTRGQMAAFLVRGLGLQQNNHPGFLDVATNHIFAEDIGRLATAGITLGCTAVGDQFCPDERVTRGQMAAFLDRAGMTGQP